jgi:uncharacterized membrane protein YfcA
MKKAFDIFIELIFWIAIFASPFLVCAAIAVIIYSSNKNLWWLSIIIGAIGIAAGIFFAEKIRKKYGCENYISKIFS